MRRLLICCIVLLAACQSLPRLPDWQSPEGRDQAELGVIRDLRTGEQLTPRELVRHLAKAPRVLVGEQHDNPDHHALQLWLLRALDAQREQGSLLLEMLDPDQQARVDAARKASALGQVPDDLPRALGWQKSWEWALYGPIVRYALEQPYPLLAANLDRREIKHIYQSRPTLDGAGSSAEAVRGLLMEQIRVSHCGLLPESQMPAMLAVQQQRDRRMAQQLLAAPQPAMLFAGAFHVRRDLGVPLHLADLGKKEGTAVLILSEVGKPVDAGAADYAWYTAALPPVDHCADLRGRLPAAR